MPLGPVGLAAIQAGINVVGNMIGSQHQSRLNWKMFKDQADFNSPVNQRRRLEQAGMNPNLAYQLGSTGNMERLQPVDIQMAYADLGTKFAQNRLMNEQANLVGTKVDESGVRQDLMKAQRSLVEANPNLSPGYVQSLVTIMESTARVKKQESDFLLSGQQSTGATTQGQAKMMLEINDLAQRVGLHNQDAAIKAKIIQSKEFQNALQDIQLKWMRDKEITPQHIYMGIMLLLQKMM